LGILCDFETELLSNSTPLHSKKRVLLSLTEVLKIMGRLFSYETENRSLALGERELIKFAVSPQNEGFKEVGLILISLKNISSFFLIPPFARFCL
jgi:hypothetical protein